MLSAMVVRVILQVRRDDCRVANTMSETGVGFNVVKVNIGVDASKHLVVLNDKVAGEVASYLRRRGLYVYIVDDKTLWIKGPSCSACRVLANFDLIINGSHPTRDRAIYNVWLPSRGRVPGLIKDLRKSNLNFKVMDVEDVSDMELTEKQFEALTLAYKRGLFDKRRKVSMTELAKELGVTPSTYSELLRKALKKVVKHYFDELI